MRIVNHRFKYGSKNNNTFRLYFLGDVHAGNILCDKERLREDIREIVDYGPEKAGVIIMGDMGDYVGPDDFRYDPAIVDPEIIDVRSSMGPEMQTVDWLKEELSPMKDQILAMLGGNHGLKNKKTNRYERWDWMLAGKMGLEDLYLGYSGFVRLQFEAERGGSKRSILSHVHHGWQGGRTKGAKVNQLQKDIGAFPDCDFIVRGHSHNLIATSFQKTTINQRGTEIVHKKTIVGHSGSYLKTFEEGLESYSERAGFFPEHNGCLKTWIRFDREGYDIFAGV